jgi:hypothetical protein
MWLQMSIQDVAAEFAGSSAALLPAADGQNKSKRQKMGNGKIRTKPADSDAAIWDWPDLAADADRYDTCMADPVLNAIVSQKTVQDATIRNEKSLRLAGKGSRVDIAKARQASLKVSSCISQLYSMLGFLYSLK